MNTSDLATTLLVGTLTILLLLGLMVLLLVVHHNRRIKHRAELAELELARDREVAQAEREAQQQTLQDVGRELHDNLGQLLTVAQMGLDPVQEEHPADARLKAVMDTLEQSIDEVRRIGRALNADLWQERTLADAISAEATRIERMGTVQVRLLRQGDAPPMTADVKTILFRAFQEIMNNALKHARSNAIDVTVVGAPRFSLTIADNGGGFTLAEVERGSGLSNIRRRCELIGYAAELSTAPGSGCTWHITAP